MISRSPWFGLLLLPLLLLVTPGWLEPRKPETLPAASDFSRLVLKEMKRYPTDGTHRYFWPRKKAELIDNWAGNTRKMVYAKKVLAPGHPQKSCYCCGLTFEVFFRAWQDWCRENKQPFRIMNWDIATLRRFRSHWFGANGDRKCVGGAIPGAKLGQAIPLKDARPGDFVQFWRHSKSGHSVIFVAWQRDKKKRITGLKYWSTQKSTQGIGTRTEPIGKPKGIDRNQIHISRIGRAPKKSNPPDPPPEKLR